MKRFNLLLTLFLGFVYSCSPPPKKPVETSTKPATHDSATTPVSNAWKFYSVERARYENSEYSVIVETAYVLPDTLKHDSSYYCHGNLMLFMDKKNKTVDSIELAEDCTDGVIIQDVTKELHFKKPVFDIASPGGSDYYTCEFIQFKGGKLNKLFEIPELGHPVSLHWKDEHTLTGFIQDRDELVYAFKDYPVEVSLDDYEVKYDKPVRQIIGYTTEVLDNFDGYCLAGNNKTKYPVKKGTTILIDSLNRSTNIVRIIVKDTIVVFVPFSTIKEKVQVNAAG